MRRRPGLTSSRRRVLAAGAMAAAVALTLTACGGGGSSAPNAAPTDTVLKLSFLQDIGQPPDPDIYYAGQGLMLTTNTYEGLLQFKAGTEKPVLEPLLATSWTASPDNRVFSFELRQGVTFHDGTPFTAAAIKASFDRRLAVNQGPAYMVADVATVTTDGDYRATITLAEPNSAFLDYLASPYGPRMMSPTALAQHAGSDHAQTYLQTHDVGTGPYTLSDAQVGSRYALKAYPGYWGKKPYFTDVELPVLTDTSAQQLQFKNGQVAAITHDLPSSAVESYSKNTGFTSYSLPTMMSGNIYVNPNKGMFTDVTTRRALQQAIDVESLVKQTYFGRGTVAKQVYPPNMIDPQLALQTVRHDPAPLTKVAAGLPSDQKNITVGYDSSNPDYQLVANLVSTQLASMGITAKVQGYPSSEVYGWVGTKGKDAPELFASSAWPDAPSPYTWGHITYDPDGGLNYLGCSSPETTSALTEGKRTGSSEAFSTAAARALETGCWLNFVDINDFIVAQSWLKGVEKAHVVTNPTALRLAELTVG
ncbi:ABC transporter substrate-binding protein [Rhodococcus sp. X156]|uniref:ABC transporter substrate-binding protein n=1 Tax=Rhodococcus sp. X156 TaxID=2499145 RepID=UPI001F495209|nr:ABC transporter substrate-binding protein [Rhodococcus sp. X156]